MAVSTAIRRTVGVQKLIELLSVDLCWPRALSGIQTARLPVALGLSGISAWLDTDVGRSSSELKYEIRVT